MMYAITIKSALPCTCLLVLCLNIEKAGKKTGDEAV